MSHPNFDKKLEMAWTLSCPGLVGNVGTLCVKGCSTHDRPRARLREDCLSRRGKKATFLFSLKPRCFWFSIYTGVQSSLHCMLSCQCFFITSIDQGLSFDIQDNMEEIPRSVCVQKRHGNKSNISPSSDIKKVDP